MSTYTRRPNPAGHRKVAGQTRSQRVVPIGREDAEELPFPNKPVLHKRPSRTRARLDPADFEKMTISSRPRAPSPASQERGSTGAGGSGGSRRSDAGMGKLLLLQEKLLKLAETVGQTIPRDGSDAAEGAGGRRGRRAGESGIPGPSWRQAEEEGGREPRQERDQGRDTYRARDAGETQRAGRGVVTPPSKIPNLIRTQRKEQDVHREQNKVRWQNVREHARKKEDERDEDIWEKTYKASSNKARADNSSLTSDRKHGERTQQPAPRRSDKQGPPQRGQQKAVQGRAGGTSDPGGRRQGEEEEERAAAAGGGPDGGPDGGLRTLPCKICRRKFADDRLEKHVSVCRKAGQTRRPVYNSLTHRHKDTDIEEYFKKHERRETPEILRKAYERRMAKYRQSAASRTPSQPKPYKNV